jgi:uncharacterized membrane protein
MLKGIDWFGRVVIILAALNLAVLAPLLLVPAYHDSKDIASAVYLLYSPTCHQYIGRSYCFFDSNGSWGLGDCIKNGTHPLVLTEYSAWRANYSGLFVFSRNEIGINRADIVVYPGTVGFKMPVCARDFGIYLGSLLGMALFVVLKDKIGPMSLPVYLLFLVPLVADGFVQLLTGYESTNMLRLVTGLIAGGASGVALLSIIYPRKK